MYFELLNFYVVFISGFCTCELVCIDDIFLCKFYMNKCFSSIWNLRVLRFANIRENQVLTNNSEFTVSGLLLVLFLLCDLGLHNAFVVYITQMHTLKA